MINEQGGKLRAGWEENLKNLSEHALLLGTSEYNHKTTIWVSGRIKGKN